MASIQKRGKKYAVVYNYEDNDGTKRQKWETFDNLQQKQLLDMIALYVMMDDSGLLCDAYNTTELGEKDCTRIYIMEKNRFSGWLLQRENALKTISDF